MAFPSLVPTAPSPASRPDVWRGDELASAEARVVSTGHGALDAQLPGGGWPVGALTEVLQAAPEMQVWQLLLPALALAARLRGGRVVLVGAPRVPFAPVLAAGGLPVEALLWVRGDGAVARAWACEQALRCADVAAVLAWLPQARAADLRRLQLAAAQHDNLLFVFRPEAQAHAASPARLRLRVRCVSVGEVHRTEPIDPADAAGRMDVDVLKRRGPPLAAPLALPARGERLARLLSAASRRRQAPGRDAAPKTAATAAVPPMSSAGPCAPRLEGGPSDAVDRVAVAA
ncbi:MAG: translesion DNA synthesis-associated protein ImuA [Variovorax sp.]|nr:MAG: translesion DNA synthesis-associated protein ImuA [Variovorax sp.]